MLCAAGLQAFKGQHLGQMCFLHLHLDWEIQQGAPIVQMSVSLGRNVLLRKLPSYLADRIDINCMLLSIGRNST